LNPATLTILSGPAHGSVVNNLDGTVTYTSNTDYSGPDSLTYQICDAVGLCDTATVGITVTGVNDPPVANPDVVSTPEDVPVTINVVANDTDPDGNLDAGSVNVTAGPGNGTATANGDGTITYTPNANYSGPDSFSYEVCDTDLACSVTTATVTTTVVAVDDTPTASDDTVSATEDTDTIWNLALNDSDVDGDLDPTTLAVLTGPANGTLVNNGDGTVTYTPDLDFTGPDALTYQICDGAGLCDTASVSITVDPVDDPPVANPDSASTPEDVPTTIDVTFNDTDPDGDLDPASVTIITGPSNGTAVPNGDGTVTYTPAADYNGPDGFTYQVCDATALCSTSTFSVTVTPTPDAPFATDDSVSTAEDHSATWDVTANDTDLDNDLVPSSVTIQAYPNHGSVSVDPATGEIRYRPDADYNGPDSFTYQVCDTTGECDTATVTIRVSARNDAPVAEDDVLVVAEDSGGGVIVIANDHDIDSILSTAGITILTQPSHGTATVDPSTGTITYVPDPDFHGEDVIEYQVCDPDSACDVAEIRVTVTPVNDPPVYTGSPIYAIIFTGTPPALTGEDLESDPMTFTIIDGALPDGLTLLPSGEWVGSATTDGVYPITIEVCDIHGDCTTSVLSVVVGMLPFTGLSAALAVVGVALFGLGSMLLRFFRDGEPTFPA
ncbi:MAG: Ig-like domain-containing protein, partial [Acidimicrobiia bacterium]|nr:Ig-like domain-containing protein [Acidimicrobiia bacterium]